MGFEECSSGPGSKDGMKGMHHRAGNFAGRRARSGGLGFDRSRGRTCGPRRSRCCPRKRSEGRRRERCAARRVAFPAGCWAYRAA